MSGIFSDHSAVKLGIEYKKKKFKSTNIWGQNNMLQCLIKEIKEKSISA